MHRTTMSILVVLALSVSASATSYLERGTTSAFAPAQTHEVTGRVRSVRGERIGKRIVTRVTLELDTAASDGSTTVELLSPGGSVDGVRAWVAGAPSFAAGEHVRVRVRSARGALHLAGLEHGKALLP